jgi:hypothetical protein
MEKCDQDYRNCKNFLHEISEVWTKLKCCQLVVYRRQPTSDCVILTCTLTVPLGVKAGSIGLRDVKISGDQVSLHFQKPQTFYNLGSKPERCVWRFSEAILWQWSTVNDWIWCFLRLDPKFRYITFCLTYIISISLCWHFDSSHVFLWPTAIEAAISNICACDMVFHRAFHSVIPIAWCRNWGKNRDEPVFSGTHDITHMFLIVWFHLLIKNWGKRAKLLLFKNFMLFPWFWYI